MLPVHVKDHMSQQAREREQQQALVEKGEFDNLETCALVSLIVNYIISNHIFYFE